MAGNFRVPEPFNEPVFDYAPGSPERAELKAELERMSGEEVDIPAIIGGQEVRSGNIQPVCAPHDLSLRLGVWHCAGTEEARRAVEGSREARREWASWPWEDRVAVFLRAAEMLSSSWRSRLNAATMLGQSKNAFQSEIDAACETVDFYRYGAAFLEEVLEQQPHSSDGVWNRTDHRPLEGFVYAVSPFNFTAIGANLAGMPALAGCGVLWKPSKHAVLSGYHTYKLLEEAGLPPGVIDFVPGDPREITDAALGHPEFGGLAFTGSTEVFRSLWTTVGRNIARYRSYPRLVGETGGKNFIVAHESAGLDALRTAIVRGAFEYQGQKCSAASRVYVPKSLWRRLKDSLVAETEGLAMGDPADFRNFVNAVIDRGAFDKIRGYVARAEAGDGARVVAGGTCTCSGSRAADRTDAPACTCTGKEGFFIRPTIVEADDPGCESMCDEIFGPVVTVHAYPDGKWSETLALADSTSPYGLTGAVFARDRSAVQEAMATLRYAAGNFYVNDKPTGAVVGQQPFGGGRASGTNDKAGSILSVLKWLTPRTLKENLNPPRDFRYPFMAEE